MMTKKERAELEQAMQPQRWGAKERVALVAEILRQKRIVRWFAEYLAEADDETSATEWIRQAEQAVVNEISPKAQG